MLLKDAARRGAGHDRQGRCDVRHQAPMIRVPVRQHQGEQASIGCVQARYGRQQGCRVGVSGIQRQPKVQQDAFAVARQLYAGAANLPRAPMNADLEAARSRRFGHHYAAAPFSAGQGSNRTTRWPWQPPGCSHPS